MPSNPLNNLNVAALDVLPTPEEIKQRLPMTETVVLLEETGFVPWARETLCG